MHTKRTGIIATIGPATQNETAMTALENIGVNFFRLNMSHGDHATHQKTVDLRNAAAPSVKLICDVCGPKIRIGDFQDGKITLVPDQTFAITTRDVPGNANEVHISHATFARDLSPGDIILLDDGKVSLTATGTTDTDVETRVVIGGTISSRRGVNVPSATLSIDAITAKDRADIEWAVRAGVDHFAVSFVRNAADIREMRSILDALGSKAKIIAKVETPQALDDIKAIVRASDMVMIARGDLAVEIGFENVPPAQKTIIETCRQAGVPAIVATQVLGSMVSSPTPSRAEASDIAHAVWDGANMLMLSEETAVGTYPLLAAEAMAKIITSAEAYKRNGGLRTFLAKILRKS